MLRRRFAGADGDRQIDTDGHLVVTDPWIGGRASLELITAGERRFLDLDPAGAFGLTGSESNVYRIGINTVSAALAGHGALEFGRQDAMEQITTLVAVRTSIEMGARSPPAEKPCCTSCSVGRVATVITSTSANI